MKKNLRYILLAFSVSLIITVVVSMMFFNNLRSLNTYNSRIENTERINERIENLRFMLLEAENAKQGYIITLDTSYLTQLRQANKHIEAEMKELKTLVEPKSRQREILIKLRSVLSRHFQILQRTLEEVLENNQSRFDQDYSSTKDVLRDIDALTKEIKREGNVVLIEEKLQKEKYEAENPNYLFVILILSILFQILSALIILIELRRRHNYQRELERKVHEINVSHAELEQIAFVASHDLQEPLRKLQTFSSRLILLFKGRLNEEGERLLHKIDNSARRMQGLIKDVVDYTTLVNSTEALQSVDLNRCLHEATNEVKKVRNNDTFCIKNDKLPNIKGYPLQLQLLFRSLIDNSVKFSRQNVTPVIEISAEKMEATNPFNLTEESKHDTYLLIKVKDNGIGFDTEFAEKIFVIFQRLHDQKVLNEGKGIGLSICKRVMTNHNGFISAESNPQEGATFSLYFRL